MTTIPLFNFPLATIFAREFLEAAILIGNYRAIILISNDFEDNRSEALKCLYCYSLYATAIALLVVAAVALPIGLVSGEIDMRVVDIIEGVSKVIAFFFIAQLSLKIPVWLQYYPKKKKELFVGHSMREMRFNIMWNIWRECAECSVFLLPFFFGGAATAIPISGLVGIAIGIAMGIALYYANRRMANKFWLCFFMSFVFGIFSVGLLVGGLHEFEQVFGMTKELWRIENPFWSDESLPMVLLKPFGYSSSRTVLECSSFWCGIVALCLAHYIKYRRAIKLKATLEEGDYDEEFAEKKEFSDTLASEKEISSSEELEEDETNGK